MYSCREAPQRSRTVEREGCSCVVSRGVAMKETSSFTVDYQGTMVVAQALYFGPSSTSKAGGVHFPDDDEPPGSPSRRDDESNLCTLVAILEKDGSYLVKAGFLKCHHCYEIVFTVPDVPTLGKELSCLPSSSPTRRFPNLRVHRINSTLEGGVKVTCEYRTHQEGVLQEEITLVTRGRKGSSLKVRFQAKVIDPHHGTPMLMEGVRCLDAQKHTHRKHSSDRERI